MALSGLRRRHSKTLCTKFPPHPAIPSWTEQATTICVRDKRRNVWAINRGWIETFTPLLIDKYNWHEYIPSRNIANVFFGLILNMDIHRINPGVVVMAERLGLKMHAAVFWEHITVEQMLDEPVSIIIELLQYDTAMTHGCVVSHFLDSKFKRSMKQSIADQLPQSIINLYRYQLWVGYNRKEMMFPVYMRNSVNDWNGNAHLIRFENTMHLVNWSGLVAYNTSPEYADHPIHCKMKFDSLEPLPIVYPQIKRKTVYLSERDVLVADDSYYMYNDHKVYDDMGLSRKDDVTITPTGRLVIKAGRLLYVSDECVRVKFDLLYAMHIHWQLIDMFDSDILDFGTFRCDYCDEYITVAVEDCMAVYSIKPMKAPLCVLLIDTTDRVVTSFERWDVPYEDYNSDDESLGPVFPKSNRVFFTDGRVMMAFSVNKLVRVYNEHLIKPKFTAYGVDEYSRLGNFGVYGMRTPDLPREKSVDGYFNVYYRLINYVSQYDAVCGKECRGCVDPTNIKEQIDAEI